MDIHLLRHGIAAPLGPESNHRDEERALTPEGTLKMRKAAAGLKRLGVTFDLVVSSPLVRARETAEIVIEVLKLGESPFLWKELEPAGTVDGVMRKLHEFRHKQSVLLVGHQPSMGGLVAYLAFGDAQGSLPFKKGAIFAVRVAEIPPRTVGELQWVLTSKMLRQLNDL